MPQFTDGIPYLETDKRQSGSLTGVVRGSQIGDAYVFRCYWDNMDCRGRPYKNFYTLFVPEEDMAKVVPKMEENPQLLFDTYVKAFPEAVKFLSGKPTFVPEFSKIELPKPKK